MISRIQFSGYTLFGETSLELGPGLVAITGETGSGKSLLMEAIELILGGRPIKDQVRSGEKCALISATLQGFREEEKTWRYDEIARKAGVPEAEGRLILARRIDSRGRHEAFINSYPVSSVCFREVLSGLYDIHRQGAGFSLFESSKQLEALDHFGGKKLLGLSREFRELFEKVSSLASLIENREKEALSRARRIDMLKYQRDEIERIAPRPGELETLREEERRLLEIARIRETLEEFMKAGGRTEREEMGALQKLDSLVRCGEKLEKLDSRFSTALSFAREAFFNLERAMEEARLYESTVPVDDSALAGVQERLDELEILTGKYGRTIEEVLTYLEETRKELAELCEIEDSREEIEIEFKNGMEKLEELDRDLLELRKKAAGKLAGLVVERLNLLEMKGAKFEIEFRPYDTGALFRNNKYFTSNGSHGVEFMISVNPGGEPAPLKKVASGGESSRILLAIKSILADHQDIPVLLFDEIDQGIAGTVIKSVGSLLKELSRGRQVFTITHSPIIAALADYHILVEKHLSGDTTTLKARVLRSAERERELERMLGETGAAAKRHAKEILEEFQSEKTDIRVSQT